MTELSYINEGKSIETGRLICKHDWTYYLDKICFCIISAAFIFYGLIIEIEINVDVIFTSFLVYFLAPFFIVFGIYCIYRKYREGELIYVETLLSKSKNLHALKDFLKKYNYNIDRYNNGIIIVIDEYLLSFNGLWRKKYVFIIDDYAIYFNITKLYPFIAPPVLFNQFILRSDLKKFLKGLY